MILRYIFALFLALDLLVSALTGGAPWQTLSARFWKGEENGSKAARFFRRNTDWVALRVFGETNHCEASYDAYVARVKIG